MKKILILVDDIYEELELWYPKYRLEESGFQVVLAGNEKGKIFSGKHGYPCKSDVSFHEIESEQFAGVVIPGGYAPDRLRRYPKAVSLIRELQNQKKMIATICHGGWLLCSAKIVEGRKVTSFMAIRDDLENAGANWIDEPVVVDRNLITSRMPSDLPVFGKAIIDWLHLEKK